MAKKKSTNQTQTSLAEQLFTAIVVALTPIQETAMNLYLLGLNVFPTPYGKKGGYPWQMLQYTRLNPEDIYTLFRDWCNLAVMTGRTSNNLFAIDCETQSAFTYHQKQLTQAGIPLWGVRSNGRGSGGHWYLRCIDGEVKNIKPFGQHEFEVRGNRCYVLAPPSLHPTTHRLYDWHVRETPAPPEVTLDQMKWLGLTLTKDSPKLRTPQPLSTLSNATREFLFSGAVEGERNNRLFTAACDLSGNNYDETTATHLLLPIAVRCGLPAPEARRTIASAYEKPRTPARSIAATQRTPRAFERALAWTQQHEWKRREGQTDKAVFLACCERARSANEKGIFRASTREIAETARITRKTASAAFKRLIKANFLVACGKDTHSGANLYRFGTIPLKTTADQNLRYYPTITTSGSSSSGVITQNHDAAERGALGKTAYGLYLTMLALDGSAGVKILMNLAHLSQSQVYRALKKLEQFSLIVRSASGYRAVPTTSTYLDEQVSRAAGTLGKGQQRQHEHAHERAQRAGDRLYKARWGNGYTPSKNPPDQNAAELGRFACGNCGQVWWMPGLEPPLKCDYCGDATTWTQL